MATNTFAVLAALASLCAGATTDQRHVQSEISWRDGDVVVVQCQIPYFIAWQQKWHTSSVLDLRLSYKQEGDQYKEERVAHLLYGKLLGKDGRFDEDPMVNAQAVETPLGRPALRVTMPLSDQGVFFCHIKYQSSQKSGNVTYSYKIDHGFLEESREVANGSLTLRNVKGHEVNVTWVLGTAGGQTGPAFVLSRGLLDQSNCPVNRPRSDILYLDRGGLPLFNDTLLLDVQSPSEGDQKVFQIRLFVKAGVSCSPNCVYYGEASGREWHSQEQNTCVTEDHQKDDDDGYYHLVKNTNSLVVACVCLLSLIIVCIVCWWMKATGITAWVRKCIQNIHCQRQEGGGAVGVQAPGANDDPGVQRQGGNNGAGVQAPGANDDPGIQRQGGNNGAGVQAPGANDDPGVQRQGGNNGAGVQAPGANDDPGVQRQGGNNGAGVQAPGANDDPGVQRQGGNNGAGVQAPGANNVADAQRQGGGGGNATGVQGQGGGGGNATGVQRQGGGGGNATGVQGQGGGSNATGVQRQGGGSNATGVQRQGGGGYSVAGSQGQGGGGTATGVQVQGDGNAGGVQEQGGGGNVTGVQGQIGAGGKNALGADVSEKATHVKQYPHSNHATKRNSIRLEESESHDNQLVSDRDAKENVVVLRSHEYLSFELEFTETDPLMSNVSSSAFPAMLDFQSGE